MPRPCEDAHPDPIPSECRVCELYLADEAHNRLWGGGGLSVPSLWSKVVAATKAVASHVINGCEVTPAGELSRRRAICRSCEHRKADNTCGKCGCHLNAKTSWQSEQCPMGRWKNVPPSLLCAFDETNLHPHVGGKRFNASLTPWGTGYLMVFRNGWNGSEIFLTELAADFKPAGWCKQLSLTNAHWANYGREDPRLFWFKGQLHVAYIGVVGPNTILHTSQLYARLDAEFNVERIYAPQYAHRNYWEKNWQFFEHDGQLYATYSISPHRILKIDGNNAELIYDTPTPATWTGGELRGGASPVLVDDEWWCFFHSRVEVGGHRVYNTGVYCFANKPPFRMTRIVPDPILVADTASKPGDQYASVVFAGGAVLRDGRWVVAHGIHDRWTELHQFNHADLEAKMVRIHPPAWWHWRESTEDQATFAAIWAQDEYKLGKADFTDKTVLDVGAHMGSFAFAVWARGCRNVHCYEPDPDNAALLRGNAAQMPGVVTYQEAVGRRFGTLYYQPSAHHPQYSAHGRCLMEPNKNAVTAITLNEAIRRAGGQVDLLKIDAEGAEFPALYGCTQLDAVQAIVCEYHGFAPALHLDRDDGDPPHELTPLKGFLRVRGFKVESRPTGGGNGYLWAVRA